MSAKGSLFDAAKKCLDCNEPDQKVLLSFMVAQNFAYGELILDSTYPILPIVSPGRPLRPRLIAPRDLPRRKLNTPEGRACLLHAIAHIEFNAINLAWDAVYRFRDMPHEFYNDWVKVAAEEAHHFTLLISRLEALGYRYGDFDAHNGLWEMAVKTADSCLARMALVPRVLEARGLDVTPGMIERLKSVGDHESVAILEIILNDEVSHVAAGSHWFAWCCEQDGVDAEVTFEQLLKEHHVLGSVRGPYNLEARLRAGFTADELTRLAAKVA